jgi:hypothetical protein
VLRSTRTRRDRRDAREHGECVGRAEAADVPGLGDEGGCHERAGTRQAEEWVTHHEPRDPLAEGADPGLPPAQLGEPLAGELGLDARQATEGPAARSWCLAETRLATRAP